MEARKQSRFLCDCGTWASICLALAHRREDYTVDEAELPWLDRPGAAAEIERRQHAGELCAEDAAWLRHFEREGYAVFEQVLTAKEIDAINADVDEVFQTNRHLPYDELKEKFKNVYVHSEAVRRAFVHPRMLARLDLILGMRAMPHQTLNLPVSSQQAAHSDEILMTTQPPGYTVAVWYALEDIPPDCGPLLVYPGSHRLPYVSAREVGIPKGVSEGECARIYDASYYAMIARLVEERELRPWTFLPRRGDALVWHSNLLHGAHRTTRGGATRKSMIAHYFGERAAHYSDLFQRPCLSPKLRD